jgi:hypothetical protein
VARWNAGHLHAAVEAWEAAYALEPDSWLALRNIAAASGLTGAPGRSAEQYLRALDLTPDVAQLRLEAIEALIAVNRFSEAVALAQAAPESSFAGRFRFLQAWAAVLHGEIRLAESRKVNCVRSSRPAGRSAATAWSAWAMAGPRS